MKTSDLSLKTSTDRANQLADKIDKLCEMLVECDGKPKAEQKAIRSRHLAAWKGMSKKPEGGMS